MKKILLLATIATGLYGAHANENQSSTEVDIKAEKAAGTDKADELITNRRFRAQNGSLSNLSMNMNIGYDGGSLSKPLDANRPNILGAADTASVSAVSGTISASYRLSKLNRVGFGTGVQMLAPLQNDIDTKSASAQREFDRNQGEFDVSNPSASFTHMNNFFGVQTIFSAGVTQYTAGNLTDAGYDNGVTLTVNTMYAVADTGFSYGLLATGTRNHFDDNDPAYLAGQLETVFGFLPQAEYVINDTFNLRTIVRSNWYQNNRAERRTKYTTRPITQSVGLGISLSRDIFLYPNVQFAHENLQAENTNVGIQANINMF